MNSNRRILLKQRPQGMPTPDDFAIVEAPVPALGADEVLVRNRFLSLDPYMRGQMDGGKSYIQAIEIGDVMNGHTVGEVVESKNAAFAPGDLVWGPGHWQEYAVLKSPPLRKITGSHSPSAWLGPMGLPGWTAYVGLFDLGAPKPGETIVVSSATGAVGALVGQLAKRYGLRTVGIAGGEAKCRYAVDELGYDVCVDYKSSDFPAALAAACPTGVDIDFENVGGAILDAVWPLLNSHARVIICGLMAQYNLKTKYPGPELTHLLKSRLTIRGFIISDYAGRFPEAIAQMSARLASGEIKIREDITDGIENAPSAFIGMLQGRNFGKTIVRIG
ncbi:NADP-dependent oxidoreductase [Bradyrhizobium uaiense]|uniref:NADP-dependent oxidoreductase n=1 Tax=Bradyrhizobium uaiense TaxID=2594946 RepID=A0A6P1BJB2_9BRAD|nr:NADP-dependent oxidoreductase [Bradyrhizobium uaiense]NEU98289.1 NADP-dependent oxidoreductase [Bradyrhizobium uaiense]